MQKKEYSISDVCGVIISYNDIEEIKKNIYSVLNQTSHLIIIDNGSDDLTVKGLKELEGNNISIIFDTINRGIPAQLNRALSFCVDNKYPLLLTMDQDTALKEGCVEKLLTILNENNKIGSVGPCIKNRNIAPNMYRETNYLITSGNLIVVEYALASGGYSEELFIDMVDVDFSLALKKSGYKVVQALNGAEMIHKVGELEEKKLLAFKYHYLSHSPSRFYYIYRNRWIVCKRFFKKFPFYCIKMMLILVVYTFPVTFQSNAKEKLIQAAKGFRDGIKYHV